MRERYDYERDRFVLICRKEVEKISRKKYEDYLKKPNQSYKEKSLTRYSFHIEGRRHIVRKNISGRKTSNRKRISTDDDRSRRIIKIFLCTFSLLFYRLFWQVFFSLFF